MLVYKFGGASVKDADSIRKLKKIVQDSNDTLVVVVSAMGKTTSRLEKILKHSFLEDGSHLPLIQKLQDEHLSIVRDLIPDNEKLENEIAELFETIKVNCKHYDGKGFNFVYDQVVSLGEVISTKIVSVYLNNQGVSNRWVDTRHILITDNNYREANVNIAVSKKNSLLNFKSGSKEIYITQGFIGSDPEGFTTTLGREGSDYTAALLAGFLGAKSLTLWKDVAGIFNADPCLFEDVTLLEELSYQEVIELAFYGARVIHPKTIKPLKINGIKLFVKCFFNPEKGGTVVGSDSSIVSNIPIFVIKEKQVLISISIRDLSFLTEYHISQLFSLLDSFRLKANIIQHSAVSFSVCVDTPIGKEIEELIASLKINFKVLYNKNLQLITIRNYTENDIQRLTTGKKIYIEQRSRNTVQFVTG
jgi:aspartate kinase